MGWLRERGWTMGLVGVMLAQAGCSGLNSLSVSGTVASAPTGTAGARELPPSQAIQASLAVAQNLENKNDAGAKDQYEKVLKLDPSNKLASRRLCVLYDRCADFSKADIEYRKLVQANPRDADLFNDWGYSFYLRGNWVEAEKNLRHALEIDHNNVKARCNLGMALGRQDKYPEALQAFRDARLSEAEARCNLAFIYSCQLKFDDARNECRRARGLDPNCAKAQELQAKLETLKTAPNGAVAVQAGTPQKKWPAAFNQTVTPVSATAPSASAPTIERAVYRSPSGTNWVPVAPTVAPMPTAPPAASTEPIGPSLY